MADANQSLDARRMAREQESRSFQRGAAVRPVPDFDAADVRREHRAGGALI